MTRILAIFGLFLLATTAANAIEWWHDPAMGCGGLGGWKATHRISDLPGCDGELPKGAPNGEIAMHDAKRALHEAEILLDKRTTEGVEALIGKAVSIMNAAPDDPRTNWARAFFSEAANLLSERLRQLKG
jgi:hypothetical protein